MKILAVICARAGSRRIKDKNIQMLCGRSLIGWGCEACFNSELITNAVVSTDSVKYANYATQNGCGYVIRPPEISGDTADISEAAKHALADRESLEGRGEGYFDYVVTLQAAVPLRPAGAIDALINEMISSGARGGLSMIPRSHWMWNVREGRAASWWNKNHYPRSQTIDWKYLEEVNAIQVAPADVVRSGARWKFPLSIVELPPWCSVDIDVEEDLITANEYVGQIKPLLDQPRQFKTYTVNK